MSFDLKRTIIFSLNEFLKFDKNESSIKKENLLNELYGSWKDTDENLSNDILNSRTFTNRDISFD